MSEPFLGEIKMIGFNFAPRGFAFCNGQLLAVSQNQSLFALMGTIYGGDGRTTFALPDMRGRVPVHAGHGPGLTNFPLGIPFGMETVTLTNEQVPSPLTPEIPSIPAIPPIPAVPPHSHKIQVSTTVADGEDPSGNFLGTTREDIYTSTADATMNESVVEPAGGSGQVFAGWPGHEGTPGTPGESAAQHGHINMQPSITVNFVIALQGVFPSRS